MPDRDQSPGDGSPVDHQLQILLGRLECLLARFEASSAPLEADSTAAMLRTEIEAMGRLIAETRAEVSGLLPRQEGSAPKITAASGELSAVVRATEVAAGEIMGACEQALAGAGRLRRLDLPSEAVDEIVAIEAAATDAITACAFQDLTGQRIKKVVQTLDYIGARVDALCRLWRPDPLDAVPDISPDARPDAALLNGPSENGLGQDAVDTLLGSSDHKPPHEVRSNSSQTDIDRIFK